MAFGRATTTLRSLEALLASAVLFGLTGCLRTPDRHVASMLDVELNPPANFELDGEPFCFGGSNNYYPLFKPRPVVDDLFEAARALDFRVMRIWLQILPGSQHHNHPVLWWRFPGECSLSFFLM
jgi:mannan endo-1,4-beta-mannosidase